MVGTEDTDSFDGCAQGCDAIYGKDGNNGIVGLIIKTYQRIKKWEKPPQS
jgi:hypothetical protein